MHALIYWAVRGLAMFLRLFPLEWVAHLGRAGGAIAWVLDARHRNVALANIAAAFPEKSAAEVKAIARENFKRIGEAYASAVKSSGMKLEDILPRVEMVDTDRLTVLGRNAGNSNIIVAIGHFGNFELYATLSHFVQGFQGATTYRGLPNKGLDGVLRWLREQTGCNYYERRRDGAALKAALNARGVILGLLSDQHAGRNGVWIPFFGRECSTTTAPAVLALRYESPLFCAVCYRTAPGRWRVEVSDEIPTAANGAPREPADIMRDVNARLEAGVRKDPANWFWVHNRWKPQSRRQIQKAAAAAGDTEDE